MVTIMSNKICNKARVSHRGLLEGLYGLEVEVRNVKLYSEVESVVINIRTCPLGMAPG